MRTLYLVLATCVLVHAHELQNSSDLTRESSAKDLGLAALSSLLGLFFLFVLKESPLSPLQVPPLPHSPVGPFPPMRLRRELTARKLTSVSSRAYTFLNGAHLLALLSGIYLMIFVMEPVAVPNHVLESKGQQIFDALSSDDTSFLNIKRRNDWHSASKTQPK